MFLKGVYQMQERWIADRAMLQQLLQKHPEWTQLVTTRNVLFLQCS